MLADAETMAYNRHWGGTVDFAEDRWADWYDWWLVHHEDKRYYRYVRQAGGAFVGEIAYHWDEALGGFVANVIIYAPYRGQGYGGQALDMLCAAAKENGVKRLHDDIAIDNEALGLFLRRGFVEQGRTDEKIILVKEL